MELVQQEVRRYLASILMPTKDEELFWKAFSEGHYHPDWIFGESNELVNIANHPMALWKCRIKAEVGIQPQNKKSTTANFSSTFKNR